MAAGSLYGLGQGIGEPAVTGARAELLEIARTHKAMIVKETGGEAAYQNHVRQLGQLTIGDLARDDFSKILILGLLLVQFRRGYFCGSNEMTVGF